MKVVTPMGSHINMITEKNPFKNLILDVFTQTCAQIDMYTRTRAHAIPTHMRSDVCCGFANSAKHGSTALKHYKK